MSKMSNRLLSRVASITETSGISARSDIRLVDHEPLRHCASTSKVLFHYDGTRKLPTESELNKWVVERLAHKVQLCDGTLQQYDRGNGAVITAMLRIPRPTRPLKEANSMTRVTATTYADQAKRMWEVVEGNEGNRYLMACAEDDIDLLLNSVKTSPITRHAVANLNLLTASLMCFDAGDTVRFLDHDLITLGEVVSCKGDNCTIKANGESVTVDRAQVIEVVRRSPQARAETREKENEYYRQVYGEEFADALTSKLTSDTPAAEAATK